MGRVVKVATLEEIPAGRAIIREVDGQSLALARVGDAVYCIDNVCTHDGGPLGEGELLGTSLECPRHGARFDITSGRALSLPAVVPVKSYPVTVEGEAVLVELD